MKGLVAILVLAAALAGCDTREAPAPYGKPADGQGRPAEQARVKDPVCGMMIDSANAKDHTHEGVKYYFCSQACHDKFEASPATYSARPAK